MYNILGLILLAFVFGLIISEYVQLISDRGTFLGSIFDRSRCDSCKKPIPWYALTPIVGRFITKKKCVYCGKEISSKYLWFEVLFSLYWIAVLVSLYLTKELHWQVLVVGLFAVSTTLLLAYEDLKNYSVPISWLLSWLASYAGFWFILGHRTLHWPDMFGVLFILGLSLIVVKASKKDKKLEYKDMFGMADVIVLALMGLLIGFQPVTVVLVLSMVSAIIYLFMQGKEIMGQQLPLLTMMLPWSILALILLA